MILYYKKPTSNLRNQFFEGKDFDGKFKALIPECYPPKYQKYINEETELLKEKVSGADKVLEGGVGIGRLIPELAPIVKKFVGIDIAQKMLEEARKVSHGYSNSFIANIPLEDLSKAYPRKYFDYSLCLWNTLGNVDDEVVVLRELAKVTKKSIFITVYLKGTLKDRKNWYETVGISVKAIDKDNEIFYTDSGLKSKSYSLEEIKLLAEKAGLLLVENKILGGVILWSELVAE